MSKNANSDLKKAILTVDLRRQINKQPEDLKDKLTDGISEIAESYKEIFDEVLDSKQNSSSSTTSAISDTALTAEATKTINLDTSSHSTIITAGSAIEDQVVSSIADLSTSITNTILTDNIPTVPEVNDVTNVILEATDTLTAHAAEEQVVPTNITIDSIGNSTQTIPMQNELTSSDPIDKPNKIIAPEIKEEVNNHPHAEIIKNIINDVTPTLIESIEQAHKGPTIISNNNGSSMLSPVSSPIGMLASPVITEHVRKDINKHPLKDAIKQNVNKFVAKFLPSINHIVDKEAKVLAIESAKLIESKIKGSQGKEIAKVVTSGITLIDQIISKGLSDQVSFQTKIINSLLKDQINNHQFRDTISNFLNSFIPKLMKIVGEIIVIGGEVGGKLADAAIEKIIPGDIGRQLGTTVEHIIEDGSKELAGLVTKNGGHALDAIMHH
ncbi:MAG: hypothetical protein EOP33_03050 [Rickettsiaceae bacterium]|nr:MAG: hypothetical protein EOP33_03050 [Rickettsiaceae bacterium]